MFRGRIILKRGNDTIRATKKQSDSNSDIKCTTVKFHVNSHNSQFDCWIRLTFYVESHVMFSYVGLKFQVNLSSGRHRNTGQQRMYKFCYVLPFGLWTSYLARILYLQGCDSLFWKSPSSTRIFNELQHSFQGWQGFINVSEFFSYKDSLFILATTRKEDFRINSTFRLDFLVYLKLLKGDKSDSSISRIVIFGFIYLFSS
jgi:hypothetical protein